VSDGSGHLALIPARGGSKGVPRKNIRLLAGKPLIVYSIETALASSKIDRVVVSTDDPEIAEVAKQHGAEVPFMRPQELASDDSPEWLTWQHAVRSLQAAGDDIELMVCISPTSPLRAVEDVDACIELLLEGEADLVCTVKTAQRNPYFNMVVLDQQGYARLAISPTGAIHRRQDAPDVFDMTTVAYAMMPDFLLRATSIFQGNVKSVLVPDERALDIDSELDFKFAEFLLSQRVAGTTTGHPK
jgi:CMP-N-acetylneuraminic acid synthetase